MSQHRRATSDHATSGRHGHANAHVRGDHVHARDRGGHAHGAHARGPRDRGHVLGDHVPHAHGAHGRGRRDRGRRGLRVLWRTPLARTSGQPSRQR
jgi:hypothetical protein